MPFFGKLAPIPLGPAAFALRMGTPIFPVCVYRLPDDTYMAEGAPLVHAVSTGNQRADQVRATEAVLRQMERFIQAHPEQWHVPHRIWSDAP
jgi:lauroyl/myristoyl acyltransferase